MFVLELGPSQDQRHCTSLSTFIKTHGRFQIYQQKSESELDTLNLKWSWNESIFNGIDGKHWKTLHFLGYHMVPQFLESPQERPIFCDTKQADDPEAKTQAIRHAFGQTGIWFPGSVVWLPGVQSYRRSCHILSHFLQVFMKPKFLWSLLWWPFKMVFVCIKMLFVEVFFVACLTGNGSSETTLATRRTCWVYSYESTFWAWVDNGAQHLAALSWRR